MGTDDKPAKTPQRGCHRLEVRGAVGWAYPFRGYVPSDISRVEQWQETAMLSFSWNIRSVTKRRRRDNTNGIGRMPADGGFRSC